MTGSRRIQRSVRVSAAGALLGVSGLAVVAAVATSRLVSAAAVLALLAGVTAARVLYTDVLRTRLDAARSAAERAWSFQVAMARSHGEETAFRERAAGRLLERDLEVSRLSGALRLAERRAADAESRAEEAAGRARQEARRAEETRAQLGRLLDEVFGTAIVDEDAHSAPAPARRAPVVDLPSWARGDRRPA